MTNLPIEKSDLIEPRDEEDILTSINILTEHSVFIDTLEDSINILNFLEEDEEFFIHKIDNKIIYAIYTYVDRIPCIKENLRKNGINC